MTLSFGMVPLHVCFARIYREVRIPAMTADGVPRAAASITTAATITIATAAAAGTDVAGIDAATAARATPAAASAVPAAAAAAISISSAIAFYPQGAV